MLRNIVGICLALILIGCLCQPATAQVVERVEGAVVADGGDVILAEGTLTPTTNGRGLLKSGQISVGQKVTVLIVMGKGPKHRGHVTVLK